MLEKEPDALIIKISEEQFPLKMYLFDNRMKVDFRWLEALTILFERILNCLGQDKRIAQILVRSFFYSLLPTRNQNQFSSDSITWFHLSRCTARRNTSEESVDR